MKCFICDREFPNKQSLGGHIASAHPKYQGQGRKRIRTIMLEGIYWCPHCSVGSPSCPNQAFPQQCPYCSGDMDQKTLRRIEEII